MNCLRKLILAGVAGLAALTPLSSANRAEAHSAAPQARYYYVYYRTCPDSPWRYYYAFRSYGDAQYYANWIYSSYGYETFIG